MPLWEDKKLADRIIDRLAQSEKGHIKFNRARDDIVAYFRPDLGSDVTADGDGSFFGTDIYEGTAPWAARVMAKGFQGNLISSASDWIMYAMKQFELVGVDELDIWLQDIKEHMLAVYQHSNLYKTVLHQFTLDGLTIGSPLMFIEEHNKVIKFLPQHYKQTFIFYDKYNEPEGVIVKDKTWTTKQIYDMFAPSLEEAESKLSLDLYNDVKAGNFHTEHTVIRAVFKGSDPIWNVPEFKKPNRDWVGVYFEEKPKEETKNTPLRTDPYFTQPFTVWDYFKKPYESVSRTPAFEAIYDVVTQQQTYKDYLENNRLKNRPPRKILTDHRNTIDFGPEGLNYIEKDDWDYAPEKIDLVGDVLMNKDLTEQIARSVKRWFHVDEFMKFNDLTTTLRQQPSVDQLRRMAAEIAVQLMPEIGTFTGGFLEVMDSRCLDIEMRAGRGPFDPHTMENIQDIVASNLKKQEGSFGVVPVFVGPLAREQKTKQELDPIINGLATLTPLFEIYPDLKFAIREYDTAEDILKAVGFPLKNLVPEDEYNKTIDVVNQAREQMRQQEMALETMKASKNIQGPVDETSVLAGVVG